MKPDESSELAIKFDDRGLIGAIVCDSSDQAVLMFAYMNQDALDHTRTTGLIHFWSRSRRKLWMKGETSGETFKVDEIRIDCDQDCLQVFVTPQKTGAACHTGRRTCFYRSINGRTLAFLE